MSELLVILALIGGVLTFAPSPEAPPPALIPPPVLEPCSPAWLQRDLANLPASGRRTGYPFRVCA